MPELKAPQQRSEVFQLHLGPLFAARSMEMKGKNQTVVHKPLPYAGLQLGMGSRLAKFEKVDATLEIEGEIGYGAAKNRRLVPGGGEPPVTELTFGGVRTFLMRRLGDRLSAGLGLGVQATSVIVQPNPVYTGHRYFAGDSALRVEWAARPGIVQLTAEFGAYPVFATDNSDSAHGQAISFGGGAELQAAWNLTPGTDNPALRGLRLVTHYRYDRYRARFPLSPFGPTGAHSVDNLHILSVLIDYAIPTGLK